MNPVLIFSVRVGSKKLVSFVLATLGVIMLLPIIALIPLGTAALSYLSDTSSSDTINAISTSSQGFYEGPMIAGDYYAWGNCTYWAYALRAQAGDPIPTSWGNANTWGNRAKQDGYAVDHLPTIGAIYQTDAGSLGHVAYVTEVDPITGNWTISEMNSIGLNVVDLKVYPASAAAKVYFIHEKAKP